MSENGFTIKNAAFVKSAAAESDYTGFSIPEIAVAGKSNVGKSTFINMLLGNGKLCRASKTAGRTRLLNFFAVNGGDFHVVDLPGYGYSAAGYGKTADFSGITEQYLGASRNLKHVFVLIDVRHDPSEADKQLLNYLYYYQKPFTVVATKADKLSAAAVRERVRAAAAALGVGVDDVTPVSGESGLGRKAVLAKIGAVLRQESPDE
jgi:GTP-binding protein